MDISNSKLSLLFLMSSVWNFYNSEWVVNLTYSYPNESEFPSKINILCLGWLRQYSCILKPMTETPLNNSRSYCEIPGVRQELL